MPPPCPPCPTHFLCIPLITPISRPQLSTTLTSFRDDLLTNPSYSIPIEAIRPLGTLHLTLGVMTLSSAQTLERARQVLRDLHPTKILADVRREQGSDGNDTGELKVSLTGLRAMQELRETSVLYSVPGDAEGVLYPFCEVVRRRFLEEGVLVEDGRELLLHATVVNTVYVPGQGRGRRAPRGRGRGRGGGQRIERMVFDAEAVVKDYGGVEWMRDVPVEAVAICRMGAKKVEGEDGEAYEVEERTEMKM